MRTMSERTRTDSEQTLTDNETSQPSLPPTSHYHLANKGYDYYKTSASPHRGNLVTLVLPVR